MILDILHALSFSRNQPVQSVGDYCIRILKNKTKNLGWLR